MIKKCRSCFSPKLQSILKLGNSYLSEFRKDDRKPQQFPLNLLLCKSCLLVQLADTPPQDILYTENYGYKSGINNTMKQELLTIVKKTLQKKTTKKKALLVVDIGANDGTLLANYKPSIQRVAFEPIKKLANECQPHANLVINDFFNAASFQKKLPNKKADIITVISCFYDMPNPNEFIKDITQILDEDGVVVIQQNYLVAMLEQNAFDNIVHEHLEYYSLLSLTNLLQKHNLEIFDVELSDINGGSFRTYISFTGRRTITQNVHKMIQKEKKSKLDTLKPYQQFALSIQKTKTKLLQFIKTQRKLGKSIAVYGASTRGNTLLQYFELDSSLIDYAVERNPEKWGTKIASVGIEIISEEKARKKNPDYLLVLPWFFKEEFLKREKKYLKNGGHFIFPLPRLEII